jgi:hypothetical protein
MNIDKLVDYAFVVFLVCGGLSMLLLSIAVLFIR